MASMVRRALSVLIALMSWESRLDECHKSCLWSGCYRSIIDKCSSSLRRQWMLNAAFGIGRDAVGLWDRSRWEQTFSQEVDLKMRMARIATNRMNIWGGRGGVPTIQSNRRNATEDWFTMSRMNAAGKRIRDESHWGWSFVWALWPKTKWTITLMAKVEWMVLFEYPIVRQNRKQIPIFRLNRKRLALLA